VEAVYGFVVLEPSMTLLEQLRHYRLRVAIERAKVQFGDALEKYAKRYERNQKIVDELKLVCGATDLGERAP
jgi:hypothetical protein